MVLLIQVDARNLSWAKCALDKQLGVSRVVDHVDILVAQLANDTVHTATLNTYAGSYWIDTVVVALNSHLGTVARDTGHTLDGNQSVLNLRYLSLEQTLQEYRACTREDDTRVVVLVLYLLYYGTYGLALVVVVARNLLLLWQVQLVTLIVNQQYLALPNLVNFTANYLVNLIIVLLVE